MFKIIKSGRIYSPDDLGQKDILIANDTIISVEDQGSTNLPFPVEIYDAAGKIILPGIIDPHVHFIGGGGRPASIPGPRKSPSKKSSKPGSRQPWAAWDSTEPPGH